MDGEPETLSDTGTNCNLPSASETISDNNQAKLDSLEKKAVHLRLILERDFKAADIKWSLFVAAAFSFRYESCLRPFPPAFLKNGVKDMDTLLDNLDNLRNISDVIDLLFYVLVRLKESTLKTVPPEAHEAILMQANSVMPAPRPQYIFQLVHSPKSNSEIKWSELSNGLKTFFAFHGNRLENFFSMLNFGIQQHLNKPTTLGNGVSLSPELSVSLPYSHGGFGWGASCIGGHLSCVALCEVIDAPDGINYRKPDKAKGSQDQNGDNRTVHYVITNCDLVRVKYLLVYAKQPTSMRFPTGNTNRNGGGIREWLARHKLFSILLGYGLMLATIGFANNHPMNYYYKMLLKKIDIALSNIKVFLENSLLPIEIYFGIPYAAPPTGRLRFSAPERHRGWKKTYFAHRMPTPCPQQQLDTAALNEDCLYLNIWTTRPVLVILYSDSWNGGSLNLPCQELAAEGVVVVTIAYRLGVLSFFNLKSAFARGNLALLDQYMALLWIKENISAFGGDPTLVTLLGHSAGADSVLHHIVSPKTTNLFHRAIIMSPNDMWKGVNGDMNIASNDAKKASLAIAQSLGCYNGSVSEFQILQCMQVKPLIDIMSLSANTSWNKYMQPVADDYLSTSEQYLPVTLDIVLNGPNALKPFDILLGTNNLDALNFYDFRMKSLLTKSYSQIHDFAFDKVVPEILKGLSFSEQVLQTLSEAVRWEYWTLSQKQNVEESVKAVEALAAMDSAANWGLGSLMLAKKLSRKVSKLYVYRYNYPSNVDLNGNRLNVTGAVHGTDLIALIGDALMLQVARRPATSDEKRMTKYFRRFVVNFIKFGFPSTQEKWSPFNTNDENIFEVCDIEISSIGCGPRNIQRDIHFWHYYLPRLSRSTFDGTSSAKFVDQGNRLKGGVFAMCGVIVALILLLLASGILLHRRRTYRPSSSLSQIAY
ncbi:unnamed protein product [Leptidea sinapis]|uniref:PARP n=1 Tax=Leptidea sinapis TaxID=189913 RepID=A0A5E4PQB5_9NEOP|nr:unnamed protein product [Leptidea sinapis]